MVIPVGDKSLVKDYIETIDKLILSGGQNVHPQFYGEEKAIDNDDYNLDRDEFELALLKEAIRQISRSWLSAAVCSWSMLLLVARLISRSDTAGQGQPFGTAPIRTEKGSVVERLFGQASQINSVHRQSIKDLAPNFRVTAFDPRDNTIEAIEAVDGSRIIGLQWHPEFLINEEKGNLELFQYLCRNYKN